MKRRYAIIELFTEKTPSFASYVKLYDALIGKSISDCLLLTSMDTGERSVLMLTFNKAK